MGNALPKQFLPINGKPIIAYAIEAFVTAFADINVIVVMHPHYLSHMNGVVQHLKMPIDITLVPGGETRYQSVQNGLAAITNNDPNAIIYIHDAARPFINTSLLQRLQLAAIQNNAAIPTISIAESLRIIDDAGNTKPINRNTICIVQTPQVFTQKVLLQAMQQPYNSSFTDDATVVELSGVPITIVDGLQENIKITTIDQLKIAESIVVEFLKE